MNRRTFLATAAGVPLLVGCLDDAPATGSTDTDDTEQDADAPRFHVDKGAPPTAILLRNQPQRPGGVSVGEEFEVGVFLGNAGGGTLTGRFGFDLLPPTEAESTQSGQIHIGVDSAIPSGASKLFITGPFTATVAGDWELVPESAVTRVHRMYDPTITIEES